MIKVISPSFIQGVRGSSPEPLTADRLQSTYTSDERRALYDAVVARAPTQHIDDVADLTLPGSSKPQRVVKSREEVLAELRNMKRRRTKYRVAPKTKNYSDVLRDVIQTQMESYNEAQAQIKIKQEKHDDGYKDGHYSNNHHQNEAYQVYGNYSNNHPQDGGHHSKGLIRSNTERNEKRRYVEEYRNERYKESFKRNEREDYRYSKDRYRNECDRVIKKEKDEEYKDRRRNDEAVYRSKDDKNKAERSYHKDYREDYRSSKYDHNKGEKSYYGDKSEHDKRREKEKYHRSKYADNVKDEYKSEKTDDDSHKRHKEDKKKNRERDKESYREDRDISREKRKRSKSISSDRHERKRKRDKEEYKSESYYEK